MYLQHPLTSIFSRCIDHDVFTRIRTLNKMIRKESYIKKWDQCHRERERKRFLFQMLLFTKWQKNKKTIALHLNFGTFVLFLTTNNVIPITQ